LPASVHGLLADPAQPVLFSVVSAWEIAIKAGLGKLELPEAAPVYVPTRLRDNRFDLLTIDLPHVLGLANLPHLHRDPFDRLLVAQAIYEDFALISSDPLVTQYPVRVIWS
jgi:PIN domain nuclease of toxin-antitoxin system